MAPRRSRPRRFLLPTLLAAVLAVEITGIALAGSLVTPQSAAAPAAAEAPARTPAPAGAGPASAGNPRAAAPWRALATDASRDPVADAAIRSRSLPDGLTRVVQPATPSNPAAAVRGGGASASAAPANRATGGSGNLPRYRGTNHVWIPSLGVSRSIKTFPCSRTRPPDAGVYRWGCSGQNNVYLLSHAWSTFQPLHDAYVGGRLHAGMRVIYADSRGTVHTYAVRWWKVVPPTTAASWAWASLGSPGMTLQTCVGSKSQYRLMVRLAQVG